MSGYSEQTADEQGTSGSSWLSGAETDRYGFLLGNGDTQTPCSDEPCPQVVRHREMKWLSLVNHWDQVLEKKNSKIKVQCQKGIPASLRAKCWPLLCGATHRKEKNQKLYETLDLAPGQQSWIDVIKRDTDRQFPFHEMFLNKDGHGQQGLLRVLKAYTQFRPDEGYCQAQGPVAAVLLMNMPMEEAFWCLVQISELYLPGYYSPLLEGVLFDAAILSGVLKRTCPAVHKHLQSQGVEPLMFATDWLMCLYSRHLPFNTLLRVWDLFFCYGVRVLFQVAVVLVRRCLGEARQRKECEGQMETLERLRSVRGCVQHEPTEAFIQEVCSVPLSLGELQRQTEKEFEKWRKEHAGSTFDPRDRCHGFYMVWKKGREREKESEKKERQSGNLTVPLARSHSSLSPVLLRKKWRKRGSKVDTDEWEGGGRRFSQGVKEEGSDGDQRRRSVCGAAGEFKPKTDSMTHKIGANFQKDCSNVTETNITQHGHLGTRSISELSDHSTPVFEENETDTGTIADLPQIQIYSVCGNVDESPNTLKEVLQIDQKVEIQMTICQSQDSMQMHQDKENEEIQTDRHKQDKEIPSHQEEKGDQRETEELQAQTFPQEEEQTHGKNKVKTEENSSEQGEETEVNVSEQELQVSSNQATEMNENRKMQNEDLVIASCKQNISEIEETSHVQEQERQINTNKQKEEILLDNNEQEEEQPDNSKQEEEKQLDSSKQEAEKLLDNSSPEEEKQLNNSTQEGEKLLGSRTPDEEKQLDNSTPEEEEHLDSSTPGEEKQLNSSTQGGEKQLDSRTQEEEKQLDSSTPEEEKQQNSNIQKEHKQLDSSIQEGEKQLESSTQKEHKQLHSGTQEEEKQLDSSTQKEHKQLDSSTQEGKKQLDNSTPEEETQLKSSIQKEHKQLDSSIQEGEIQLGSGTQEEEKQLDSSTQEEDNQLDSGTQEKEKQLDSSTEEVEKRLNGSTQKEHKQLDSSTQEGEKQLESSTQKEHKQQDSSTQEEEKQQDSSTQEEEKQQDSSTQEEEKQQDSSTQEEEKQQDSSTQDEKKHLDIYTQKEGKQQEVAPEADNSQHEIEVQVNQKQEEETQATSNSENEKNKCLTQEENVAEEKHQKQKDTEETKKEQQTYEDQEELHLQTQEVEDIQKEGMRLEMGLIKGEHHDCGSKKEGEVIQDVAEKELLEEKGTPITDKLEEPERRREDAEGVYEESICSCTVDDEKLQTVAASVSSCALTQQMTENEHSVSFECSQQVECPPPKKSISNLEVNDTGLEPLQTSQSHQALESSPQVENRSNLEDTTAPDIQPVDLKHGEFTVTDGSDKAEPEQAGESVVARDMMVKKEPVSPESQSATPPKSTPTGSSSNPHSHLRLRRSSSSQSSYPTILSEDTFRVPNKCDKQEHTTTTTVDTTQSVPTFVQKTDDKNTSEPHTAKDMHPLRHADKPKRKGLFHRFRGETSSKSTIPKILIQDFSEGEEKLSSKERRRRRREQERKEKEEEKERKKREKELEKEKEKERKKPQTRGKSFQVLSKKCDDNDISLASSGSQTLGPKRNSAPHSESYF